MGGLSRGDFMYDYELIEETVRKLGPEVMICLETAADYLGLSNLGYSSKCTVYSAHKVEQDGIATVIEDAFNTKNYTVVNEVACTTPEQTILDMIDYHNDIDVQILLESLSNYYYMHNESFDDIECLMDTKQREVFNSYFQDAIDYYTED